MSTTPKRLTVVLGMARSGTSAVTAGLECLGIELGDNLLPPNQDNKKGFFEDIELYELNVNLMLDLDQSWDSLPSLNKEKLSSPELSARRKEAQEFLLDRTNRFSNYGLKDPRMCQLLPFWQPIFDELGLEVNYLIVVRNPRHVASSLVRLNWSSFDKALFLWFNSMVSSMRAVAGKPHIVVKYDNMLTEPKRNLERIAQTFKLDISLDRMEKYASEFLDDSLRNIQTNNGTADLNPVPVFIDDCFSKFEKLATDQIHTDSPALVSYFEEQSKKIEENLPLYRTVQDLERKLSNTEVALQAEVDKYQVAMDAANEQSATIKNLQIAIEETSNKLAQSLIDTKHEHNSLIERVTAVQNENTELNQKLLHAQTELNSIHSSLIWRLTSPIHKFFTNTRRMK